VARHLEALGGGVISEADKLVGALPDLDDFPAPITQHRRAGPQGVGRSEDCAGDLLLTRGSLGPGGCGDDSRKAKHRADPDSGLRGAVRIVAQSSTMMRYFDAPQNSPGFVIVCVPTSLPLSSGPGCRSFGS